MLDIPTVPILNNNDNLFEVSTFASFPTYPIYICPVLKSYLPKFLNGTINENWPFQIV